MALVLGINAFHAGAAAALVADGKPVAAVAEERLNRIKYHAGFPAAAIRECLRIAGAGFRDVDAVAVGRDSSANLARKVGYALKHPARLLNLAKIKARRGALDDLGTLLAEACGVERGGLDFEQHAVEHHLAHTASAYYGSPWERAAGLTVDGSGDFVTAMLSRCEGERIEVLHRLYVPHSLGSLYTMICQFIGYGRYGDEGKVMGLASLGEDSYRELFEELLTLEPEGLKLGAAYFLPFGENQGLTIDDRGQMHLERHYSGALVERLGERRPRHAEITRRDRDLAHGLQRRFEDGYMHLLNLLHARVPEQRVAIAGGCALNSVANGKLFARTPFRETWIQPAAGDDGLALGAALYASRAILGDGRRHPLSHAYLGPAYGEGEVQGELDRRGVPYRRLERQPLLDAAAAELAGGRVLGWFQGRMEWGPRALGNRSILAHPGWPGMKDVLNARIKHREEFRPFAPTVLVERVGDIFEHSHPSPFMLHVYGIRPAWRRRLSAVNHVDDTGRLQSLAREENPLYYDLIRAFERQTGLPVVLNTSFNENEPIVCRPTEAIDCYLRTRMDALAIGPFFCRKDQDQAPGPEPS